MDFMGERGRRDHHESESGQGDEGLAGEERHHDGESTDEPHQREPNADAARAVDVLDSLHEVGIVLVELPFDLRQNPLLSIVERHPLRPRDGGSLRPRLGAQYTKAGSNATWPLRTILRLSPASSLKARITTLAGDGGPHPPRPSRRGPQPRPPRVCVSARVQVVSPGRGPSTRRGALSRPTA